MNPKVSVIIPTYNRAGFLEQAVDSVLQQSFRDYELIVADDGSTDNTAKILKKYGDALQYISAENRGPAAARNRGIRISKGECCAFLDSDDRWRRDKLRKQVEAMSASPEYLISHTREIWYRRGKILPHKKKHKKLSGRIFSKSLAMCMVSMSTVMVRKKLFEKIGFFDENLPCCEDYDFWLRAAVDHRFLLVEEELTFKDGGRDDQVSALYRVGMDRFRIRSILNLLGNSPLNREQRKQARAELERKCRVYGNGCIKHGRKEEGEYYLSLPTMLDQK